MTNSEFNTRFASVGRDAVTFTAPCPGCGQNRMWFARNYREPEIQCSCVERSKAPK